MSLSACAAVIASASAIASACASTLPAANAAATVAANSACGERRGAAGWLMAKSGSIVMRRLSASCRRSEDVRTGLKPVRSGSTTSRKAPMRASESKVAQQNRASSAARTAVVHDVRATNMVASGPQHSTALISSWRRSVECRKAATESAPVGLKTRITTSIVSTVSHSELLPISGWLWMAVAPNSTPPATSSCVVMPSALPVASCGAGAVPPRTRMQLERSAGMRAVHANRIWSLGLPLPGGSAAPTRCMAPGELRTFGSATESDVRQHAVTILAAIARSIIEAH